MSAPASARPLRVLVNAINDNAEPRGPDRYLEALLLRFAAMPEGPEIVLAHAPWQRLFARLEGLPRLTRRVIAAPRRPAPRLLWQAAVFPALATRLSPDVVFLPNMLWTPGLRRPCVVTAHDLLHFRTPEKFGALKARLLRPVIRAALRRADAVIAVSAFTANDARRFAAVPAARLHVIPEGGPAPRERRRPLGEPFLLFVGKIERSKNADGLARAFLRSEALRAANVRLVIAGPDGNGAADLAPLLAEAGPRIERVGFVDEAALERLYLTCRAFAFPSVAEGFGLVLLEAMAHGAPVVAAAATSLPEVAGDAALLVPPGDEAALADALEAVALDDALALDLAARGRARLSAFCWDRAAAQTLAVLRGAALGARSEPSP
ncbi:MAG: glycosyltransferase family 1 protein [Rhodobacteraceae bacterium]|nr:MAG: glycosyltransferase family 1 protein [Paracoccaceae bacterium]